MTQKFNIGGLLYDRPFRVRRLGHFHYFSRHIAEALHFYTTLMGFKISDALDTSARMTPEVRAKVDDPRLYFTRYCTDHHAFVLCSDAINVARGRTFPEGVTVGQITWQVGSLKEVVDGERWFGEAGMKIMKSGRDTPGSNWHTYTPDPDGHPNEIYYGMEQIGWNGLAKPYSMHRGFYQPPELPQIAEYQEIENALAEGIDMSSGFRDEERLPFDFVVDGIRMPRPFKVTGIGPVRLFVGDMDASLGFYRDRLGLSVTEETRWNGFRCVFLRANTEHHSMALYENGVRDALELPHRSRTLSFGARLNDYAQLKDAIKFLKARGVRILYLPPELAPGMDYTAYAVDPDGHLLQLYYYMEQVGWDGRPRPPELRCKIDNSNWPEALSPMSDTFTGEPFFGPWA